MSATAPPVAVAAKPEAGLRLIILYKLVKGIFALSCSITLFILVVAGQSDQVADIAAHVRHHLTAAWALELVDRFVDTADRRHIEVLASALALDGTFVLFEWCALRTGKSWGSWLVVLATASLLPFEVVAIARHASAGRIVVFLVNVAIVVYLARRSLARHGLPWAKATTEAAPPKG